MSSVQSGDSASTTPPLGTKMRLPPIGFWSYARQDDELSNGDLTQLRTRVESELQQQFGRTPIEIFQDTDKIPHGAKWEKKIGQSLLNSTFFIPILTPNFLQSKWCCREVRLFLERQQQLHDTYPDLQRESRIFPILYVDVRRADTIDPDVATLLSSLQSFDFSDLRYEPATPVVRRAVANFATSIRDLLLIEVDRPPSPADFYVEPAAAGAAARARALAELDTLTAAYEHDCDRFEAIADRLDRAFAQSGVRAVKSTRTPSASWQWFAIGAAVILPLILISSLDPEGAPVESPPNKAAYNKDAMSVPPVLKSRDFTKPEYYFSWVKDRKWGVDGDCRNWLKVSISGDDVTLKTPAGKYGYKIKAISTLDSLIAHGPDGDVEITQSLSGTSITYPETGAQELTPCK